MKRGASASTGGSDACKQRVLRLGHDVRAREGAKVLQGVRGAGASASTGGCEASSKECRVGARGAPRSPPRPTQAAIWSSFLRQRRTRVRMTRVRSINHARRVPREAQLSSVASYPPPSPLPPASHQPDVRRLDDEPLLVRELEPAPPRLVALERSPAPEHDESSPPIVIATLSLRSSATKHRLALEIRVVHSTITSKRATLLTRPPCAPPPRRAGGVAPTVPNAPRGRTSAISPSAPSPGWRRRTARWLVMCPRREPATPSGTALAVSCSRVPPPTARGSHRDACLRGVIRDIPSGVGARARRPPPRTSSCAGRRRSAERLRARSSSRAPSAHQVAALGRCSASGPTRPAAP